MPVIHPVKPETATPEQAKVLDGIKAKMGKVPNIYATIAHSPSTLEGMLAYGAALKKGVLTPKEIEAIALAVAEKNGCHYCVAAHTAISKMQKFTVEETVEWRRGISSDVKLGALVKLAVEVNETRGRPTAAGLDAARKAGYGDAAIVEIVAWVAYNIFTNYINDVAGTEVDFPAPPAL
jgi:uncharacterized peroxidase-related enzyme